MSQICHRISKEPGKDISQSRHELHSKNRGNKSWKSRDRPFFNKLAPNPKSWFMKLIQFHSFAVLLQMHIHSLPRIKAPVKYPDLPKWRRLQTLVWAYKLGKPLSLALRVAQVRLYLTFGGGFLYCRTMQARKGPTFDTVFDETLHPTSWELLCMPAACILATWEAKFVVKHICGKCTACK